MRIRRIRKLALLIMAILLLSGCGTGRTDARQSLTEEQPVVIPVMFIIDAVTDQKSNESLVNDFNEMYQGQYQVEVEWLNGTTADYRNRLKMMNVTDQLPAIITDIRFLPSFYQLLVEEERLVDLSPYIKRDEEWQNAIEPRVLEACTETDGQIFLSTNGTSVFSCSGIFWNKELFAQAGIDEFPQTWEQFYICCEQLKASGITPLALHTEGTAWSPMLFATAKIADNPDGLVFMETLFPDTYQNQWGLELVTTLKTLFEYGSDNAVYNDFDTAFEDFFTGRTAMIANGFWMLEQIDSEWQQKIGFAAFPQNRVVTSVEMSGWAIVNNYDQDVIEGAAAFLKFRTLRGNQQKTEYLDSAETDLNPVAADYAGTIKQNPVLVPNYQMQWNSVLQDNVLKECLPKLISGEMTENDVLEAFDNSIRESDQKD